MLALGHASEEIKDNCTRMAANDFYVIFWAENIFAFEKVVLYHRYRLALAFIEC
jgi:hypothetical protein